MKVGLSNPRYGVLRSGIRCGAHVAPPSCVTSNWAAAQPPPVSHPVVGLMKVAVGCAKHVDDAGRR